MKTKPILTIFIATLLFACTKTDPNLVTISGEITNPVGEFVAFNSNDTTYTASLTQESTFELSFHLDSSMYIDFKHGPENTAMYVKPGDKIHLTIDTKQFDETIMYEGSPTSSFLAKKYLLRENYDFFGEVYYLGSLEEYQALLDEYKASLFSELDATNDILFINNEMSNIEESSAYYAKRHGQFQEQFSEYGQDVRIYAFERSKLYAKYNFYAALDSLNSSEYDTMLEAFQEDANALISNISDGEYAAKAMESTEGQINSWKERKTLTDNMPGAGEPAIGFTYPDINGNDVSLASLQGKLVYVDVWATWCGPCIAEIPALQKLEENYHGKNITFLSVSVDDSKEKWEKMVKEENLGGIQIWADGWSQITKDYAIFGIPRFMLFSADGKIISTDAPRPSSPEIRNLLDSNL